jgi:hypothetical protein
MIVLLIIAMILFVFWLLGLTTRFIASGLIHLSIVVAIILIVIWLLRAVFNAF